MSVVKNRSRRPTPSRFSFRLRTFVLPRLWANPTIASIRLWVVKPQNKAGAPAKSRVKVGRTPRPRTQVVSAVGFPTTWLCICPSSGGSCAF